MAVVYVSSARGNKLASFEGYLHRREKEYKEKTIWKCVKYDLNLCTGRIHVVNDLVVKQVAHNHPPNPADMMTRQVVNDLKESARETMDPPQNIVANVCRDVSAAVIGKLPGVAGLKRTVRRQRRRIDDVPVNPVSLMELVIPDRYKKINDENFLLYDSGVGDDRILVFSTQKNLQFMAANPHWYCDGTFKASPSLFEQLYTIHVVDEQFSVPVVLALLPNRTQITYERLFDALKNLQPGLAPVSIMTDYERAAINVMRTAFPTARQSGCFFHFKQCIYRRIQAIPELLRMYTTDETFALQLNCLGALAFVPPEDVVVAYEELVNSEFYVDHAEQLLDILEYMDKTWIGRLMRGGRRRQALYPIEIWNQHQNVEMNLHKTNNFVESWNNTFNGGGSSNNLEIYRRFKATAGLDRSPSRTTCSW